MIDQNVSNAVPAVAQPIDHPPDHIYDVERGIWLLGELPIVNGIIDGQGCDLAITQGLQIYTKPLIPPTPPATIAIT